MRDLTPLQRYKYWSIKEKHRKGWSLADILIIMLAILAGIVWVI